MTRELVPECEPAFTCEVSLGLVEAALGDAGIAAPPRYLGGATAEVRYVPVLKEPTETLWLTVHRDLREPQGPRRPRLPLLLGG